MKRTISKTINLLIGIIVLWTWLSVTFRLGRLGAQSEGGLGNLRYFTVLSNLLQCGVSLAYCCGRKVSRWKYASTTAIAFTFFVVLFFLGPARGYDAVYTGANFWSHLVVPLLAMVDFLCFDREGTFTLRDRPCFQCWRTACFIPGTCSSTVWRVTTGTGLPRQVRRPRPPSFLHCRL